MREQTPIGDQVMSNRQPTPGVHENMPRPFDRAARACYEGRFQGELALVTDWDKLPDYVKDRWRDAVSAVLSTGQPASAHPRADVTDEELEQWAKLRADDAGRLARELISYRRSATPSPESHLVADDLEKTALIIWRNLGFANDRLDQVPILAAELRKLLGAISSTAHLDGGDHVDKALAWDAAQASFQKGYERGKAHANATLQTRAEGDPPLRADATHQFEYLNSAEMVAANAPSPDERNWETEFNALSPEQQGKIRHCADRFGVPLIAAYYRAKALEVIEDDPAPQSNVRVTPLEWKPLGKSFEATTPFGEFYAQHYSEIDGEGWTAVYSEATEIGDFPTADDAKVAAQADYERRILSVLSTTEGSAE